MEKALLIENQSHELSEAGEGEFQVESNFAGHTLNEIAGTVANAVFHPNRMYIITTLRLLKKVF